MKNSQENETFKIEIPAQLDIKELEKRMTGGKTTPRQHEMLRELAEAAQKIARPVGVYKVSRARVIDGDKTDIDGVIFNSRVLNKLLSGRDTVIPFIVTEGKELDEFPLTQGDMMKRFYLDTIKTMIVANGVKYLKEYVQKKYNLPQVALMNPGEIEDWHISRAEASFQPV